MNFEIESARYVRLCLCYYGVYPSFILFRFRLSGIKSQRFLKRSSGHGEPEAQICEQIVMRSGLAWTILRSSWFAQKFSGNFFVEEIAAGEVVLPVDRVAEPFVDVDDIADIADIAFAALTDNKHHNQLYELTGSRLLTFGEALGEIAKATGRHIDVITVRDFSDYVRNAQFAV